ncbi:phosphatase [Aspergillus sclerotialis]|uniref:Phosphatase n=1 Tax=Aspergillus sclerotialis TaxID=2070753 RepID=A0A3A2ZK42_9EURO|nr:phosphatase [Aspergillus sclerotialis]
MATVVVQQQQTFRHTTPPPSSISPALNLNRSPSPVPNKHLPICPTGQSPVAQSEHLSPIPDGHAQTSSLLYPPDNFTRLPAEYTVYSIDAETLAAALDHLASQPLPDPNHVFPWLHGLHPENQYQLCFFTNRKRNFQQLPKCWRGITLVKLGGDLTKAKLKGAVAPEEVLSLSDSQFFLADPQEGLGIRNFHIQTAKLAPLSDIVIYAEDGLKSKDLLDVAGKIASAQHDWNTKNRPGLERHFNTFILSSWCQPTVSCSGDRRHLTFARYIS